MRDNKNKVIDTRCFPLGNASDVEANTYKGENCSLSKAKANCGQRRIKSTAISICVVECIRNKSKLKGELYLKESKLIIQSDHNIIR